MNSISCPRCEKSLPSYANYCAYCGEPLTSSQNVPTHTLPGSGVGQHGFQHASTFHASSVQVFPLAQEHLPTAVSMAPGNHNLTLHAQATPGTGPLHSIGEDVAQLHAEDARPLTWQKVLDTPLGLEDIPISPRPTSPRHKKVTPLRAKYSDTLPFPPAVFFWLSLAAVLIVSFTGLFGIFASFGRGTTISNVPTLTASSNIVAIGATVQLQGNNFTPNGRIGLTRDAILPIADTGGASIVQADAKGQLKDTIIISPDWQAGIHTINAEDAKLHKIARFSLLVTGKSASLRPAHFTISATSLDFGSGDIATNSTRTLTLDNTGGGQITWQGSTDAPWLVLSPDNGTFTLNSAQVTVGVDRANLRPGMYTGHINFLSNVGSSIVTVTMQVIPLIPGHYAVFQLSRAVLAFTAPDGGALPPAQTLMLSNPGVLPLQWSASTSASWLTISPYSGSVQNTSSTAGSSNGNSIANQSISVSVNTSTLLPGTYSGTITFTGQGQVKNSPQQVLVTTTITPQCSLQVSPSLLSFAGVYQQPVSVSKTINIGTSQSGCTTPLQWSATTTAPWLGLSSNSGTTPAYPTVSVNSTGLQPGTYNSSIVFTTTAGTQTLPVSFTVAQASSPIMNVSSAALTYTGVVGQTGPAAQSVVIANSLGGVLNWRASVATSIGGNWLSVTPSVGSLSGHQSTALSVSVAQFKTFTAGTYNGTITLIGTDGAGHPVPGSPQVIPVSFVIQASCAVTTGPTALSFTSVVGQVAVPTQPLTIAASGACSHGVTWTAASAASWLLPTPATGTATPAAAGRSNIGVASSTLIAGTYTSTVTVTALDSVTHQALGAPVVVSVTLTVQQACTLQVPSVTTEAFKTVAGQNPAAQTFTLAVGGVCTGNVTITPTVALGSGTGWLTVTPAASAVLSGGTATFTVTVIGKGLTAGTYGGSITLVGSNGGKTIAGSPQTVGVSVAVAAPASLSVSAGAAITRGTDGVTTQPVNIANTGSTSLNWTASLSNAPSFVSLGTASGTLAGGATTSTGVVVNATNAAAGSYTASVTITGTDSVTGTAAVGSPITVNITITIAPPSMQVNTTQLTYSTPAGSNPASQSINISNIGGGTLTWSVGAPSASWLSVSPTGGSDGANVTSSPTFMVQSSSLNAGTYTATVVITPSSGSATTVTVTLTVTAVATPTPTPNPPTPTPTTAPTPTPTPTTAPTPTPSPTAMVEPSPTPTTVPAPTPSVGATPTKTT